MYSQLNKCSYNRKDNGNPTIRICALLVTLGNMNIITLKSRHLFLGSVFRLQPGCCLCVVPCYWSVMLLTYHLQPIAVAVFLVLAKFNIDAKRHKS